jgi:hypothetical protein
MKKSLYNIEQEYMDLMQAVEAAEGEMTEEQSTQLEINEAEREGKSVAYICVIKDKESIISTIDDEIKRLTAMKKREQSHIERLKTNLLVAVNLFGEYTAGMFTVGTRKSSQVSIDDEAAIPLEYITSKIVQGVDKKAIKEAIKAGDTIEGASVITNFNLNIK